MEETGRIILLIAVIVAFFAVLGCITNCSSGYEVVVVPGPELKCPKPVVPDVEVTVKCPDVECPVCPEYVDLEKEICPEFPGNGYGWKNGSE